MAEPHRFAVRVYYEDTDFSGNVYHAQYLKFFERARTEWLRTAGVSHSLLARDGLAFAVRSLQIEFVAPAHIDDALEVQTNVLERSGARLRLEQSLYRGDLLLTRAEVLIAAIRADGRPTRLPQAVREAFA